MRASLDILNCHMSSQTMHEAWCVFQFIFPLCSYEEAHRAIGESAARLYMHIGESAARLYMLLVSNPHSY